MPFMNDSRKVQVSKELFRSFLNEGGFNYEDLKEKLETRSFEGIAHGSAVIYFEEYFATVWAGVNTVNLMIGQQEINSFKFLIQ